MTKYQKEKLEKELIKKMPFRFGYFLNKSKELKINKFKKTIITKGE